MTLPLRLSSSPRAVFTPRWERLGAVLIFFVLGCGPSEPHPRATATLTAEERDSASFIQEESREWYLWHNHGNRVQREGKFDEALDSYNRAQKAWPKSGESTDTALQKAYLYLRLRQPAWAVRYADRIAAHYPRDSNPPYVRAFAYYDLGDTAKALEQADRLGPENMARRMVHGLVQMKAGDRAGGTAAVVAAWTDYLKRHHRYPAPPRPEDMIQIKFLNWAVLPLDAHYTLTDARLDPSSLENLPGAR